MDMPDNSKQKETVTNVNKVPGYKSSRTGYKVNQTYFDDSMDINKSLKSVTDTLVLPKHLQGKYKKGDFLSQDDIYDARNVSKKTKKK